MNILKYQKRFCLWHAALTAVRFEFRDGPAGFNVYREIQVIGQTSSP